MRPEEAWETIKGDLQREMPKGTFDQRVRGTRFAAFEKDNLTITAPDAFTRAWLEDRLTQTITRQLGGSLNTAVQVRFITASPEEATRLDPQPPATPPEKHPAAPPTEETFRPLQTDLHKIITRPHAQTVVPAYLLRWLPYLGPDGGWFLVAMYQAFYFAENARVSPENTGTLFRVSRAWLRTWSGLGTNKLAGLLEATSQVEPGSFISWFLKGTTPAKGRAREYCFRVEMPLTPGDLEGLTNWLCANGIKDTPVRTLEKAVNTPIKEIIPFPTPPPASHHQTQPARPTTVLALVQRLAGKSTTASNQARILELGRQLQTNILPPGDNLHLSHYFLRNWVKRLKAGPAWIVAILRDKGFQDSSRGILRDRVKLTTGYQELATLLGVSQERISDWLPPLTERVRRRQEKGEAKRAWQYQQKSRQQMENFIISKTGTFDTRGAQKTTYVFRIRLDDPLIAEHAKIVSVLEAVLWQMSQKNVEEAPALEHFRTILTEALQSKQAGVESKQLGQKGVPSVEVENKQVLEGLEWNLNKLSKGWSGLRAGKESAEVEFKQLLEWTPRDIKASLIKLFNIKILYEIQQLFENSCLPEKEGLAQVDPSETRGGWMVSEALQVLTQGGIQKSKCKKYIQILAKHPENLSNLIGWLIYGYANKTTLDRRGIDTPAFYALARFEETVPPPECEALSKYPLTKLKHLVDSPYEAWLPKTQRQILTQAKENGFLAVLRTIGGKEEMLKIV